jgi:hypothetical protein
MVVMVAPGQVMGLALGKSVEAPRSSTWRYDGLVDDAIVPTDAAVPEARWMVATRTSAMSDPVELLATFSKATRPLLPDDGIATRCVSNSTVPLALVRFTKILAVSAEFPVINVLTVIRYARPFRIVNDPEVR